METYVLDYLDGLLLKSATVVNIVAVFFLSETVQKQELVLKINFSSAAFIESGNHPFTDQTAIKAAPIAQISFRFPVLATAQN